jgi:hypothetical protein
MKTVQVGEFGVEHVKVAEAADPSPGQGEVLIATEAATINPADFAGCPASPRGEIRIALWKRACSSGDMTSYQGWRPWWRTCPRA